MGEIKKKMDDVFKGLGIGEGQTSDPTNPMNIAFLKAMQKLRDDIKANLASKGANVSMTLSQSIEVTEPTIENGVIKSTLIMEDYGKFRDKGVSGTGQGLKDGESMRETQSPFKFKTSRPSLKHVLGSGGGNSLRDWANVKGLNPWAVATQTKKLGIKGNKFYSEITTPERWRQFAQSIEKALADGNNSN